MRILDRIGLVLFSIIIIILSVLGCVTIFGWVSVNEVADFAQGVLSNQTISNIILVASILFILLALKCIFFGAKSDGYDGKEGILLQNDNGKLLITKETLQNIVNNVISGFESAENSVAKIAFDDQNEVYVYITLFIREHAIIKELSNNIQNKIKQEIKKTSDLEVKEVNIKVKDVKQEKKTEIKENV